MPSYARQREVPHSPARMFDLVSAVDDYPSFLPWCEAVRIQRREATPTGDVLVADMVIRYKVFRERFSSRVSLDRQQLLIDVSGLGGAMRHLSNRWRFCERPDGGCLVEFLIDFEFRNPVLRGLMEIMFDRAAARFMGAFEARADQLYGQQSPPE